MLSTCCGLFKESVCLQRYKAPAETCLEDTSTKMEIQKDSQEDFPRNEWLGQLIKTDQCADLCLLPSSQRHTLPKEEHMHSISEVIILNNDQHQH